MAGHLGRAEASLKHLPATPTAELWYATHRADSLIKIINDKAGHAVVDNLRNRSAAIRDNRRAASHRFNHHEPERLRPVNGKQQRLGAAQQNVFVALSDLA